MNNAVYTITDPDEELDVSDLYWEELYLLISPHKKPKIGDDVLWVVGYGGVAGWNKLDYEQVAGDIVPYCNVKDLPKEGRRKFIEACFNKV